MLLGEILERQRKDADRLAQKRAADRGQREVHDGERHPQHRAEAEDAPSPGLLAARRIGQRRDALRADRRHRKRQLLDVAGQTISRRGAAGHAHYGVPGGHGGHESARACCCGHTARALAHAGRSCRAGAAPPLPPRLGRAPRGSPTRRFEAAAASGRSARRPAPRSPAGSLTCSPAAAFRTCGRSRARRSPRPARPPSTASTSTGARFTGGGEPTTGPRLASVRAAGAVLIPRYGTTETDILAYGCPHGRRAR